MKRILHNPTFAKPIIPIHQALPGSRQQRSNYTLAIGKNSISMSDSQSSRCRPFKEDGNNISIQPLQFHHHIRNQGGRQLLNNFGNNTRQRHLTTYENGRSPANDINYARSPDQNKKNLMNIDRSRDQVPSDIVSRNSICPEESISNVGLNNRTSCHKSTFISHPKPSSREPFRQGTKPLIKNRRKPSLLMIMISDWKSRTAGDELEFLFATMNPIRGI